MREYESESKKQYWYWRIIATLAMAVLLPFSISPLRKRFYEIFLVWHVALSVLVVAGCYLHIYYRFELQWGYQYWIIVTIAVWGFDRLMRFLRIARNGVRTAEISSVGEDYLRIDIKGVASGMGHAYLYFPTITWRIWENHPFSVAATILPSIKDTVVHKKDSLSDTKVLEPKKFLPVVRKLLRARIHMHHLVPASHSSFESKRD